MTRPIIIIKTGLLASLAAVALTAQAPQPASSLLVDGHVHIVDRVYWEGIDPWKPQPIGDFDFARARAGGLNVVFENLAPYGYEDYNQTVKQLGRFVETFYRVLEKNRNKMELALTSADVRRIVASGKTAVLLGVEAGFDQDGDLDILRLWYRLGIRSIQFSSHWATAYADAAFPGAEHWNGINDRGRQLIAEMNRLGMLIDITHSTEPAMRQIIEASRAPVVLSHGGIRAVTGQGGIPDDILQALVAKGGLIGINSTAGNISPRYTEWARGRPARGVAGITLGDAIQPHNLPLVRSRTPDFGAYSQAYDAEMGKRWQQLWSQPWQEDPEGQAVLPTIDDYADYIARAVKIAGPTHIGIGMDLFTGRSHLRDFDARGYRRVAEALRKRNVPSGVLGENWLRVLDAAKVR